MIVRRNLTNFQPRIYERYTLRLVRPNAHLNPRGASPCSSENRSFFVLLPAIRPVLPPPSAIPPPATPRKAWSTTTTAQGPILSTHNLQFHILFPSRVRQRGVEARGGSTRINSFLPPGRQSSFLPGLCGFLRRTGVHPEIRGIVIYDIEIIRRQLYLLIESQDRR